MKDKSNLYIPGAIILAGFFIAVGIYMSGDRSTTTNNTDKKVDITLKTVGKEDNILGEANAPIKIVEFSDTECPFCKRFHNTMHSVMNTYGKDGKVAWVYRHFPLDSLHKKARKEAEAVECANELGGNTAFWNVLDAIYTNTTSNDGLDANKLPEFAKAAGLDETKFNECLSSGKMAKQVESEYQDGMKAGVNGTPHSIFVLKDKINTEKTKEIEKFVTDNRLFDREGNPLVRVANKNTVIDVNGALPLEMIKNLLDIVLK